MVILGAIFVCIAVIFGGGYFAAFIIERSLAAPGYKGAQSDHFDGTHFHSYGPIPDRSLIENQKRSSMISWVLKRPKNTWEWRENAVFPKPHKRIEGSDIVVTYINHTTVLVQTNGLNIITDPVFARRASPFSFVGPKRFRAPGVALQDLPPIDLVLLSHNHYDHLDLDAMRKIARIWRPKILAPLGNAEYLNKNGIVATHDMDWWDTIEIKGLRIDCVPAQHFAARAISDRNKTLWCGFMLHTSKGLMYFAGDTGYGPFVQRIQERYKSVAYALLPIGAYKPEWFMTSVHISPIEALQIHHELGIKTSIATHHSTFRLADDGQDEPMESLREHAVKGEDFRVLQNGESTTLQ